MTNNRTPKEQWWIDPWRLPADRKESCSILIVGVGAGGAFAAWTLAKGGREVVVVDRGYHINQSNMPRDLGEAVANLYSESGFRASLGTPPCPIAGGMGLGGSTLINSAICFATPESSLEHWNQLTKGCFKNYDAFYKTQKEIEAVMHVSRTPDYLLSGNDRAHRDAAVNLGWKEGNIRRNTPKCGGCGRCNAVCSIGGKNSVDQEILPKVAKLGGRIYTGSRVKHIKNTTDKNVVSIDIISPDGSPSGSMEITCDTLILCAGSIATPEVLLQSEVAPNNKAIGVGLHIHPVINTWAMLEQPIYQRGSTQGHYIDEFAEENILLEANPIIAGAFFQAFPLIGMDMKTFFERGAHMASSGGLLRDTSEGIVSLPQKGASQISYELNERDTKKLLRALEIGAELWLEGVQAEGVSLSIFGSPICKNMDEVRYYTNFQNTKAERLIPYSSHPQASCRIGRALDNRGRLRGTTNIYVMDASALPSNVGRNPQISVMTVATILAQRML